MNKLKSYDGKRILYSIGETCSLLSMSRNTVIALAKECGAYYKVGRAVKIDVDRTVKHIREKYAQG